jgi:hypothetical protein
MLMKPIVALGLLVLCACDGQNYNERVNQTAVVLRPARIVHGMLGRSECIAVVKRSDGKITSVSDPYEACMALIYEGQELHVETTPGNEVGFPTRIEP